MKQAMSVFVLAVMVTLISGAQTLKKDELRGKVKTVDEKIYATVQKSSSWEPKKEYAECYYYSYDTMGNITEKADYKADGSLNVKQIYTYDAMGNKNKVDQYNDDGSLSYESVYTYQYGANGKITEEAFYSDGSLKSKSIYAYATKGNKTEEAIYKANGLLDIKFVYAYDAKGNMTEVASYGSDGALKYKDIYAYDVMGNMTENAEYRSDGALKYKDIYAYKYDVTGNWIEKTVSIETTKNGKTYFEPRNVTVRIITYYP